MLVDDDLLTLSKRLLYDHSRPLYAIMWSTPNTPWRTQGSRTPPGHYLVSLNTKWGEAGFRLDWIGWDWTDFLSAFICA